jgi:hypothetical protein
MYFFQVSKLHFGFLELFELQGEPFKNFEQIQSTIRFMSLSHKNMELINEITDLSQQQNSCQLVNNAFISC